MTVRETMVTNLIVVRADAPLADAARLLVENRITGLPVVDAAGALVGVISEMDLLRTIAEPHRKWGAVRELMTANPITIDVNAPLHDAFDCLMTHTFRRVLVVDQGRLVGLISRTDLLPAILDHLLHPPRG